MTNDSFANGPTHVIFPDAVSIGLTHVPDRPVFLSDHMGGFDIYGNNRLLNELNDLASKNDCRIEVWLQHPLDQYILDKYDHLDIYLNFYKFRDDPVWTAKPMVTFFQSWYKIHPKKTFEKFLCCFSGSPHVGRKLLVAALSQRGMFDRETCTKNFLVSVDNIDGYLDDIVPERSRLYRKFFVSDANREFLENQTVEIGKHDRFDHAQNIKSLEAILAKSFINLVSETLATSYVPFVTEKFVYPVITRNLFLAYAQPGWHQQLVKYFGFRLYDKIFDYSFDQILNPVERLTCLLDQLSKFSNLSSLDWQDLYDLQRDEIEFNYDHYMSDGYYKKICSFEKLD